MPSNHLLPYGLAVLLAAIPAVTGLLILLFVDLTAPLAWIDVDFKPLFLMGLVIASLMLGLHRSPPPLEFGTDEKLALAVFLLVALGTSALRAPAPSLALETLLWRGLVVLAAISAVVVLSRSRATMREAYLAAVVAIPLLHLPILVWLYANFDAGAGYNWRGGPAGFWHVRVWGMVLTASLAAAVGMLLLPRFSKLSGQAFIGGIIVVLSCLLCFSGTRAGLLTFVVALVLSLALFPRQLLPRLLIILPACALGTALSFLLVAPEPAYGIANSVAETAAAQSSDALSAGRQTMWLEALRIWQENPIFGVGYSQFVMLATGRFEGWIQPHNALVHWLMSFGVVGATALVYLLMRQWLRTVSCARASADGPAIGAVTGLNALIAFGMLDGTLYHIDTLMLVAVLIAIARARPAALSA